jgi:protein gp37
MAKSKIEWTDEVWNPITGCTKVSQGCEHCYAETIANRFWATQYPPNEDGSPRKFTNVRLHPERLEDLLKWRKPRRVFVNSMSDLFHEDVPDEFIAAVWGRMIAAPQHTFMILTKRPIRMTEIVPNLYRDLFTNEPQVVPNVWLGVSVEDQATADERIPYLLQTPSAVRFVSYEPALGPVDFNYWLTERYGCGGERANAGCEECWWQLNKLDWIIMGGESGPGTRPMHPDWALSMRDQCQAAGVPFFFKQWGGYCCFEQLPEDGKGLKDTQYEPIDVGGCTVYRVGKKAAGRILDGRTWDEFPEVM